MGRTRKRKNKKDCDCNCDCDCPQPSLRLVLKIVLCCIIQQIVLEFAEASDPTVQRSVQRLTIHYEPNMDNMRLGIVMKTHGLAATPVSYVNMAMHLDLDDLELKLKERTKIMYNEVHKMKELSSKLQASDQTFGAVQAWQINSTITLQQERVQKAINNIRSYAAAAVFAAKQSARYKRQIFGIVGSVLGADAMYEVEEVRKETKILEHGLQYVGIQEAKIQNELTNLTIHESLAEQAIMLKTNTDFFEVDVATMEGAEICLSKQQFPYGLVRRNELNQIIRIAGSEQGGNNVIPPQVIYSLPVDITKENGVIKITAAIPHASHLFVLKAIEAAYLVSVPDEAGAHDYSKVRVYDLVTPQYLAVPTNPRNKWLVEFDQTELENCQSVGDLFLCKKRNFVHSYHKHCSTSLVKENVPEIFRTCPGRFRELPPTGNNSQPLMLQLGAHEFMFTQAVTPTINCTHEDPKKTYVKRFTPLYRIIVPSYCSMETSGHYVARVLSPHHSEASVTFLTEDKIERYTKNMDLLSYAESQDEGLLKERRYRKIMKKVSETIQQFDKVDRLINTTAYLKKLTEAVKTPLKELGEGVESFGSFFINPLTSIVHIATTCLVLLLAIGILILLGKLVYNHMEKKERRRRRIEEQEEAEQNLINRRNEAAAREAETRQEVERRLRERMNMARNPSDNLPTPPSSPEEGIPLEPIVRYYHRAPEDRAVRIGRPRSDEEGSYLRMSRPDQVLNHSYEATTSAPTSRPHSYNSGANAGSGSSRTRVQVHHEDEAETKL